MIKRFAFAGLLALGLASCSGCVFFGAVGDTHDRLLAHYRCTHYMDCGCGEFYWSEWFNDPPACCDPCSRCGRFIGARSCVRSVPFFQRFCFFRRRNCSSFYSSNMTGGYDPGGYYPGDGYADDGYADGGYAEGGNSPSGPNAAMVDGGPVNGGPAAVRNMPTRAVPNGGAPESNPAGDMRFNEADVFDDAQSDPAMQGPAFDDPRSSRAPLLGRMRAR